MKRIALIAAILLCFATAYGQDTAPTKQETMDWIAEKIQKHINLAAQTQNNDTNTEVFAIHTYLSATYNENKLVIKEKVLMSWNNNSTSFVTYTVDLTKITNMAYFVNRFAVNGANLVTVESDRTNMRVDNVFTLHFQWLNGDERSLINFDDEPNLKQRMAEAFATLIKYNTQTNEKF